jgi:hypothetical protein
MGSVPMKVGNVFYSHGDACVTYALYIYCDHCGSFNIRKYFSLRQWILIISSCSLEIAMIYLFILMNVGWLVILLITLSIVYFAYILWGFPAYRCMKCGKFTTYRYNTRNYISDESIIDVPDHLIQKYNLMGWPDDQTIESYLSPPIDNKHKE